MSDPLNDPAFPDRPQTQDFWRLADVALAHDATSYETDGIDSIVTGMVDLPSLMYVAQNRIGTAYGIDLDAVPTVVKLRFLAIYLDAFALGVDFERRGGHRED